MFFVVQIYQGKRRSAFHLDAYKSDNFIPWLNSLMGLVIIVFTSIHTISCSIAGHYKWIYLMAVSGVAVVTAKASSNLNNEKEKEDDGVSSPQDGNLLRSAPAASAGAASENGESTRFVRVSSKKHALDVIFSGIMIIEHCVRSNSVSFLISI